MLSKFIVGFITLILLAHCTNQQGRHNYIAITFDDLPADPSLPISDQIKINNSILSALKSHQIKSVGFVNEGKIFEKGHSKEKISILKSWIKEGHELGNHTYSHFHLSSRDNEAFKKDIINGDKVSKGLFSNLKYFRYPFLDTGVNEMQRQDIEKFLTTNKYIIAPVTIDNDDWVFNDMLIKNPSQKDKILEEYLVHTKNKIKFFEYASRKMFNRNIKHVLLLHANLINSYALDSLLNMIKYMGYEYIDLDTTLKDKAYLSPNNFNKQFGVSWLQRWDKSGSDLIDWTKEPEIDNTDIIKHKKLILVDHYRKREIPVEVYLSKDVKNDIIYDYQKIPLVIINHGYGAKNTEYSFIANHLAEKGYFVASIQHDLGSDKPLPRTGDLFKRRMPLWQRGTQNISFVISEFKKMGLGLAYSHIILIGHSNGGDMSMLFAEKHPEMVYKIISLDSLRYPFPVSKSVSILSIRANDTKADPGVLPESGATIVELPKAKHIELSDRGPKEVQAKTLAIIDEFLDQK